MLTDTKPTGLRLPADHSLDWPLGLLRHDPKSGTDIRITMSAGDAAKWIRKRGQKDKTVLNGWPLLVSLLVDLNTEDDVELHLDDIAKGMRVGKKVARAALTDVVRERAKALAALERALHAQRPDDAVAAHPAEDGLARRMWAREQEAALLASCRRIAEDPFGQLDAALTGHLVGERNVAGTVLLVLASAHSHKPAAAIFKAQSGSGKSWAVKAVLALCPAEFVYPVTSMSARALIHETPGRFAHVVVFIEEAETLVRQQGTEINPAAEMLRVLISERVLRYSTVERDPESGQHVTVHKQQEGPTGLITTTVRGQLDPELETRCISLWLDESVAQTRAVMEARAAVAAGEDIADRNLTEWHDFFRYLRLGPQEVTVPFARYIAEAMPSSAVRARRDFDAVITMVKASAMLHRLDRQVDAKGRLVAQVADYAVALRCIGDALAVAHDLQLSENARAFLEGLRDKLFRPACEALATSAWDDAASRPKALAVVGKHDQFPQDAGLVWRGRGGSGDHYHPHVEMSGRALAKALGISEPSVRRYAAHCEASGLIERPDDGPRRGRYASAAFTVTSDGWDALASGRVVGGGLPQPADILARIKANGSNPRVSGTDVGDHADIEDAEFAAIFGVSATIPDTDDLEDIFGLGD